MVVFWQLAEKHWTTRIWLRRCENKFLRQCPAKCVDLRTSACIANTILTVPVGREVEAKIQKECKCRLWKAIHWNVQVLISNFLTSKRAKITPGSVLSEAEHRMEKETTQSKLKRNVEKLHLAQPDFSFVDSFKGVFLGFLVFFL